MVAALRNQTHYNQAAEAAAGAADLMRSHHNGAGAETAGLVRGMVALEALRDRGRSWVDTGAVAAARRLRQNLLVGAAAITGLTMVAKMTMLNSPSDVGPPRGGSRPGVNLANVRGHFTNQVLLPSGAAITLYPRAAETDEMISARVEKNWARLDEDQIINVSSGTSSGMPQEVQDQITAATREQVSGAKARPKSSPNPVGDGRNFQARRLAAEHLFPQLVASGLELSQDNVVVAGDSSMILLQRVLEVMAGTSPALQNGVNGNAGPRRRLLLVEEGHFSKVALHVENAGLMLVCVSTGEDGKTDSQAWKEAIEACGDDLAGVMVTQPGNPFSVKYSREEALAITRVFNEAQVPVVIDSAYDRIHNEYNHFATMPGMWSHTFVIGGVWGYKPSGEWKIGVAASGDQGWFDAVEKRQRISIPPGVVRKFEIAVTETPQSFVSVHRVRRRWRAEARWPGVRKVEARLGGGRG